MRKANGTRPDRADAFNDRGSAKQDSGDLPGAISDLDEAIRLAPKDRDFWYNRGSAKQDSGDLSGAIADYDEAIRLDPKDPGFWSDRGSAKVESGDLDGAIGDHDEAIRLDPKDPANWSNRGSAKAESGDLDGAIGDYDEAIRLDPKDPDHWHSRGAAKAECGDLDGAVSDFRQAVELDPNDWDSLVDLAEVLIAAGRHGEAVRPIETARARIGHTDQDRLLLAYLLGLALHLDARDASAAEADADRLLAAGVRLTGWDFSTLDRFYSRAEASAYPEGALERARALHEKVKAAGGR